MKSRQLTKLLVLHFVLMSDDNALTDVATKSPQYEDAAERCCRILFAARGTLRTLEIIHTCTLTSDPLIDMGKQCAQTLPRLHCIQLKVKVKVSILIVERRGPELIPDSRQSACR